MNILSKDCEVVLKGIIKLHNETGSFELAMPEDTDKYFPHEYMDILPDIVEKLKMAGMVYRVASFLGGGMVF